MQLTSSAFQEGGMIPKQCTGDGKDVSPPLQWSGTPANTRSFALICDDPDAPRKEPWVHWVVYDLPGETHELQEGVPPTEELPGGAKQGNTGRRGTRTTLRTPLLSPLYGLFPCQAI